MPKYRLQRVERGERRTTYETEAENEDQAWENVFEDEAIIVSETFKQHDADNLSCKEI